MQDVPETRDIKNSKEIQLELAVFLESVHSRL